ncbi:uncharacterized protein LOC127289463 isoform X3 [Leptopilina boulardi]|uniref:uncharacterized protein LOC127289463 isoform X3 n=1 Tax=Leptopilina boulardi TaxID=63433 RepID=UPI0021F52ED7|nr:uncharacterized protein LOC127289463 isoform X3 [Leptopilina boulardi]XP_051173362.1 uncharacterized protein LOC127289463 isoform X3 [Leptopilina boulardi]XP_051173364.1 uncharacterized protein LOC127289463 isoform X3 [Leptopilina boulardi]
MAHFVTLKELAKTNAKRQIRTSSSGRAVKSSSNLLTSEDEASTRKKSKKEVAVETELKRLRSLLPPKSVILQKSDDTQMPTTSKKIIPIPKNDVVIGSQLERLKSIYLKKHKNLPESVTQKVTTAPKTYLPKSQPEIMNLDNNSSKQTTARNVSNSSSLRHIETDFSSTPDVAVYDFSVILKSLETIENSNQKQIELYEVIKAQNAEQLRLSERILEEIQKRNSIDETQCYNSLYEPLEGFPLKTVEEFQKLNEPESGPIREKLRQHLIKLGGTKLREFLHCALKQVLTDELVYQLTWLGDKDTEKFGDTKVSTIFFVSAQKCTLFKGPTNIAEYKLEMKQVMRITKQRYRNAQKKNAEDAEEQLEEILEESFEDSGSDSEADYDYERIRERIHELQNLQSNK